MKYEVMVFIFIKPAVLNPEEKVTAEALRGQLGFPSVQGIRMGKCHIVSVETATEADARTQVNGMCQKLLANPVTETFEIAGVISK